MSNNKYKTPNSLINYANPTFGLSFGYYDYKPFDFLGDTFVAPSLTKPSYYTTDETDKEITITVNIPGYKKEEVVVQIEDNILKISAQNEKKGKRESSFSLWDEVDIDGISAKIEDGVLEIKLPKVEKVKKVIEVK